ncbi:MAG TPA: preprotein translocase subunit SecE [Pseudonocardiaceae bacterium]|nr:preprotein translocase subunit SecE [Pseudonocardiaceae bacterium]
MSEDRAHETQERLEDAEAPQSAATARRERSASRPTPSRGSFTAGKDQPTRARGAADTKVAPPARLMRFLREVVAELTKVIWPSRRELVVYTVVVLVFVSVMVALVSLLDMGLGRAVLTVFG